MTFRELEVMQVAYELVSPLDPNAQQRVMAWLSAALADNDGVPRTADEPAAPQPVAEVPARTTPSDSGSVYVYQGDELGLPQVDVPPEARCDPAFAHPDAGTEGRDGCRVPLPWSGDESPYGFSSAGAVPSWLPQPGGWGERTVERQRRDQASDLAFTTEALAGRRRHWRGRGDRVHWLDSAPGVLAFTRDGETTCVFNTGRRPASLRRYADQPVVLLASCEVPEPDVLPPGAAVWLGARAAGADESRR